MNPIEQAIEALERIADPRNKHFAGDAQVVAREALKAHRQAAQDVELLPPDLETNGDAFGHESVPCWSEDAVRAAIAAHQARQAVPQDYALVSVDTLKRWGVYDYVMKACVYPLKDTPAAPTPEATQPTQAEAPSEREAFEAWYGSLPIKPFPFHSALRAFQAGHRAALATPPAPEQVERDREDAERWRWLASDCDGNAQDDFLRWLSGTVAPKATIDAAADAAMKGTP